MNTLPSKDGSVFLLLFSQKRVVEAPTPTARKRFVRTTFLALYFDCDTSSVTPCVVPPSPAGEGLVAVRKLIKSLLQWEKVDFAKQKTDEVSTHGAQFKNYIKLVGRGLVSRRS